MHQSNRAGNLGLSPPVLLEFTFLQSKITKNHQKPLF